MRSRSFTSRSGRSVTGAFLRSMRLRMRWMSEPMISRGRSKIRQATGADREQHEPAGADPCRLREAGRHPRPRQDRGQHQHGQHEHCASGQQGQRGDRRARRRGVDAGHGEHPELHRGSGRLATRNDARECPARELRCRDREPRLRPERDALKVPEADEARGLGRDDQREPQRVDGLEVLPGSEHRDERGKQQVERERGDEKHRDAPDELAPARCRHLPGGAGLVDRGVDRSDARHLGFVVGGHRATVATGHRSP